MKLLTSLLIIAISQSALCSELFPVTEELQGAEYQKDFVSKICGPGNTTKWTQEKKKECDDKYQSTFLAKLAEVYPRADWNEIKAWCSANPLDCLKWNSFEEKTKDSHREQIRIASQPTTTESKVRRASFIKAFSSGAGAIGAGLQQSSQNQPRPINCSGTTINGITNATCY